MALWLCTIAAAVALASGCATQAAESLASATSAASAEPEPRCASAGIQEEASTRLASLDDSVNRLLAFPSDVPSQDRAQQQEAWDQLSDDVLEVVLCMHLLQEEVVGP